MLEMDDLEDGEIAEESKNNDSDCRFGINLNDMKNNIENKHNIERHFTQTTVNNISPIFQSMFNRKSDSLFGSSDTDLRFNRNQFNKDCDLREIQTNHSIKHSLNRNINNNSFVAENLRKANLLNTNNDLHSCHSSVRQQLIDNNNSFFNPLPNIVNNNNNNLRQIDSQKSHSISSAFQVRPEFRSSKALLPTPVIPLLEPIETPFQQTIPLIGSQFDIAIEPKLSPNINPQSIDTNFSNKLMPPLLHQEWSLRSTDNSNPNLFTYSSYLSPTNANQSFLQTNNAFKFCDSVSAQKTNSEFFETLNAKALNQTNNNTIVLSSNEIEEVMMSDVCLNSGSQSPYDPEQEVLPLSPPNLESNEIINENILCNKSKDEELMTSKLKTNETFIPKVSHKTRNSFDRERDESIRKGSEERNERLNRLLKSNSIGNKSSSRSCPKRHIRKTNSSKESSVRKSPKRCSKAINSRSPVRKSCHKVSVHKDSCKRAKINRRKSKKIAKRKVLNLIPQNYNESKDLRPKSRNEMKDASYEDLLEEYKRIQSQLKDLEKEEEKSEAMDLVESDKEERVIIEQNIKICEINDDSKDGQIISGDDDELELRRLALESKKIRVQTPVSIDGESLEYEELDENVLRQQLLKSLLKSKNLSEPQSNEECVEVTENQLNLINQNIELTNEIQTEKEIEMNEEIESSIKVNPTPVVPIVKPKLIINFGDDSTDDEQEVQKTSRKVVTNTSESISPSFPTGLDSFLKQARLRTEPQLNATQISSPPKKTAVVGKLSITQQMEYKKLKAEIARREKFQINDSVLEQNEIKWKSAKTNLDEKVSKVNALKMKVSIKRNLLRKAQQNARKMQEQFIAATRVVSATAAEFHALNDNLKTNENAVLLEKNNVNLFEKQCIRIGLKLRGNTYKLPISATVKRNNKDSESFSPNKKRTKSESIQLSKQEIADEKKRLQELEKIYSKRLQDLKNTSILRPVSPKMFTSKNPQITEISETIIDKTIPLSKVQESQKALKSLVKEFLQIPQNYSLVSFESFIEMMFSIKSIKRLESIITVPETDSQLSLSLESNTNLNLNESVLSHLHSYRFFENQTIGISSDHWTNNLNPSENICRYDLLGTCNDEKCLWQHFNTFLLDSSNKIVDLLLYDPKLAGITSEINDKIDAKTSHNLRQKLLQFSQNLINSNPQLSIESQCRQIANQIRNRSNQSVVCLLTRRIPKLFSSSKSEVPFDDLLYKFNIKDKSLVLNEAKISELRLSIDPDIYFLNRFYAPEGVPISAELETSLASDPNNIQLWIKLAYYHITKSSNHNFSDSIDRALNVLSRALELNRNDPELYEHYLFIYSNRVLRNEDESKFSLINICRKVVIHCPHYRVWKCFLSLCITFDDKTQVSAELLNNLINNIVINHSLETRSHQILEVLMYKIHLHLHQNNFDLSVLEFSEALNKSSENTTNEIQSQNALNSSKNQFCYVSDELTDSDRVFSWLCFTHLLIYKCLPAHCFQINRQGFPQLIDKNYFIFNWSELTHIINIEEIRKCLNIAIELCYSTNNSYINIDKNSLALYTNLAELNRYDNKESTINVYEDLMKITQNDSLLWLSIVEHRFKSNENHINLIEILKESPMYLKSEIKVYLSVANHYFEIQDLINARNEILLIASFHYNCQLSHEILKLAFETLLFEDDENNHNFELINARKSKRSRSPILWLSFILLLKIDSESEHQIDSAFQMALTLCTLDKSSSVDLQLLWSNYIKFMANNISNQKQFLDVLESIRHCCLTVSDPTFQSQIVQYFCEMLSNKDKLNALIQFSKLIPENISITMNAISFAIQMNKKEICWLLINSIIFDKKVRFQYLQFWKIAIALAIERSDHLSVHKFLQISISLMPYNKVLWQTFKTYETSVKHVEHLKQGKNICENQIKLFENIF